MNKDSNDIFDNDLLNDEYFCYECGAVMGIVEDVLVCPKCGHSVDLEDWITEPENYEEYYPLKEDAAGFGNRRDDEDW